VILYLTRTGILEPLGQSQVFSYLKGLSNNYKIILITHEKHSDWSDTKRRNRLYAECRQCGIKWLPQRFYCEPKFLAPLANLVYLVWFVTLEVRREKVRLIHARSYIPTFVALVVGWIWKVPFIFDMRALWAEELITSGRLQRGSWLHKAILASERLCLSNAECIVSLTNAAVGYLRSIYPKELAGKSLVVIPTCADLTRFMPSKSPPSKRVVGCLGTLLSGWFRLDWLAAFFAVAAIRDPNLYFEITTRDDPQQVRDAIGGGIELQSRLSVSACLREFVPDVLQGQIASVMFYAGGELSELGRSPTRLAEILGSGLPVVTNEGVGDVTRIIRDYRVGILVSGSTEDEMNQAWDELDRLLADPELQSRCRVAAEKCFALESGIEAYSKIYSKILQLP
jgi:glycosyltransferase involved in cell wall biosynthesis